MERPPRHHEWNDGGLPSLEDLRLLLGDLIDGARRYTRDRPVEGLVAAFAAGLVAGLLLGRRK
jgi:hypothetical protein